VPGLKINDGTAGDSSTYRREKAMPPLEPASTHLVEDPDREPNGEANQAEADETEEELLTPIAPLNFRKEVKAVVNEIPEASRGKQHE
jgi:hypothetical protein